MIYGNLNIIMKANYLGQWAGLIVQTMAATISEFADFSSALKIYELCLPSRLLHA